MENNSEEPKQKPAGGQKERISIFIDGSNFYHGLKEYKLGKISFKEVIQELAKGRQIGNIYYYTATLDREYDEGRYRKHEEFLYTLQQIPHMKVIRCKLRRIFEKDGKIRYEVKGADVHLANDMLVGAYENLYDVAILISGDEDFVPVVKTLLKLHKRVENGYFRKSSSRYLRKICSRSINMRSLVLRIKKLRQNPKTLPSSYT